MVALRIGLLVTDSTKRETRIPSTIGSIVTKNTDSTAFSSNLGGDENPLFPPEFQTAEQARTALLHIIRREPRLFGFSQTRWTLASLKKVCHWLRLQTLAGLSRLLKRLGIKYKRGREYVHSPDELYLEKLSLLELTRLKAYYEPRKYVFLYLDEFTIYRQPSVGYDYEAKGQVQPLAKRSHRSNTKRRVIGVVDAVSGKVTYAMWSIIKVKRIADFLYQVRAAYPDAECIYIALDNWPVHYHPDVLVHLEEQQHPWKVWTPPHWAKESKLQLTKKLPIQFIPLPTYASWLNPIEKLWRWLNQEVLHLHRYSNDWPTLIHLAESFLGRFHEGSKELLRYIGLMPD